MTITKMDLGKGRIDQMKGIFCLHSNTAEQRAGDMWKGNLLHFYLINDKFIKGLITSMNTFVSPEFSLHQNSNYCKAWIISCVSLIVSQGKADCFTKVFPWKPQVAPFIHLRHPSIDLLVQLFTHPSCLVINNNGGQVSSQPSHLSCLVAIETVDIP